MRALVARKTADGRREKVLVEDWADPAPPKRSEATVQAIYTGITNGTERNDILGGSYAIPDDRLPASYGYQHVGRIVALGNEVTGFEEGDLVFSMSPHYEYVNVAADDSAHALWRLPAGVDPTHAALFGMAFFGTRACRMAEPRIGETVLVAGAGVIGQVACQLASIMGAHVTLVDLDARRLELARSIVPSLETLHVDRENWDDVLARRSFDAVIDLAGAPGYENRLLRAAGNLGRVVLFAGRSVVNYDFMLGQINQLTIKHSSGAGPDEKSLLIDEVAAGRVVLGPFLQDVVAVTEADRIYRALRDEPDTLFGTVFVW